MAASEQHKGFILPQLIHYNTQLKWWPALILVLHYELVYKRTSLSRLNNLRGICTWQADHLNSIFNSIFDDCICNLQQMMDAFELSRKQTEGTVKLLGLLLYRCILLSLPTWSSPPPAGKGFLSLESQAKLACITPSIGGYVQPTVCVSFDEWPHLPHWYRNVLFHLGKAKAERSSQSVANVICLTFQSHRMSHQKWEGERRGESIWYINLMQLPFISV